MQEPSLETSRRALGGGIAAALVLGVGGFLLGRATTPEVTPVDKGATVAPAPPTPQPTLGGPLARSALLALAGMAADAAASGAAPHDELPQSEGRRFEIRLPFGCDGPAPRDANVGWRFDQPSGTLRVFVTPELWNAESWPLSNAVAPVESIEGFWIERPWTSNEACPAGPPERPPPAADADEEEDANAGGDADRAAEPPSAPRTLAIGQVYTTESPRSGRRGSAPFEAVARIDAAQLETSRGFRLRISGRLAAAIGRAPVLCRQPDPATRPVCLITASIDEVAIENAATRETMATWTLGQRDPSGTN